MNFQLYKLPKLKKENLPEKPKKKLRLKLVITLILSLLIVIGFVQAEAPKQFLKKTIVESIAKDLKSDPLGYTNFLLMGVGGDGHEGGNLTDTILIASVNPSTSSTLLTSLPRDLYVSHPKIISQRINSVYANQRYQTNHTEAAQVLEEIIENLTDMEIHYHIKADFEALVEIVDQLGGITIDNQQTIFDPEYPGPKYTFQTFSLPKGIQKINGETALKFARSRKSTSDFDRSRRQQQLIFAIKDEAINQNIVNNPTQISNLYSIVSKNIETDLQLSEILTLAKLANNFPAEALVNLPIHDDPNALGGFLYNPPRSEFNNYYVLLPADQTNSQIHTYFSLYRKYPFAMASTVDINLLNGTNISGFAGSVRQNLRRFGFKIIQTSNADNKNYEKTLVEIIGQNELLAQQVMEALNTLLQIPESQISYTPTIINNDISLDNPEVFINPDQIIINITLGNDLKEVTSKLNVFSSLYSRIEQAIRENRAAQRENQILNTKEIDSLSEATKDLTTTDLDIAEQSETETLDTTDPISQEETEDLEDSTNRTNTEILNDETTADSTDTN